jgi:clan AA aspartic protease (TIGR02281 family)
MRNLLARTILMLTLSLLVAGCGAEATRLARTCGPGSQTTLAVELRGQLPVVRVVINDRSADLIIDTGATTTVLNQAAAAILGLDRIAGPSLKYTTVQGGGQATRATVASMRLADLVLSDVPVAVTQETPEDGVLGLDVLSQFDLDVNLPKREIVLHQGGLCADEPPPFSHGVLELPAARLVRSGPGFRGREPYLMVPVRLDGVATFGMLDSGAAAGSLVSKALAMRAGMPEGGGTGVSIPVLGFGERATLGQHRFGELLVGREQFINPSLLVGGDPRVIFPVILGYDYFITHRIWFNFAADRIFVVPFPPPPLQ